MPKQSAHAWKYSVPMDSKLGKWTEDFLHNSFIPYGYKLSLFRQVFPEPKQLSGN